MGNEQSIPKNLPSAAIGKQNKFVSKNKLSVEQIKSHQAQVTHSSKSQFFYIQPMNKQFDSTPEIEDETILTEIHCQKAIQDGKMKCDDFVKHISVSWDKFTKIKIKNYLEDYIFMKQIGKGAFGTVCKVKMKYGGLCRSAKIIKCSLAYKQKNGQKKLLTEVTIPIKLDHPNIIKLFQVYQWKQQFVLITQLCEGGDLYNKVKLSGKLSEATISDLMKQVLSGVHYLHINSIVHRDLKLQNVLYDNQSKCLKIIDFGISIQLQKGKKLSMMAGTPFYMAPQVIKGQYDSKCDVWSCGVMLYILVSGYPPFTGRTQKEILNNILSQPVQFKGSVWNRRSKKCIKLISAMLKKNPQQRLTALQCLNSPWIVSTPDQQFQENGAQIISNLQNFHFKNKLKAVVYTFIASQLYSNKDKEFLLKAFKQIDKDGDGVIGKEQLLEVFGQYSNMSLDHNDIENILSIIDTNQSGLIDFTQFLVAASNQEQLLAKQRLQNAFSYLDTDHSGYISIDQVKSFLDGTQETAEQIRKIFEEVDTNGDGTISRKQFMQLLLKRN